MEISTKRYPALPRSERRRLALASSSGTIKATYTAAGSQSYWQLDDNSLLATDRDVYTTGNIAAFGAPDPSNVGAINQAALDNAIASALTDYAKADHTHPDQALQAHHHTIAEVDDLTASLGAKLNTADVGYSRTNAAAKFVAFPTLAFLNQQGYTNNIASNNTTEYIKGILRWLKDTMKPDFYATYIGVGGPGSIGTFIIQVYGTANTTGPDTTLPLHCSGMYLTLNELRPFYVTNGVYYETVVFKGIVNQANNATVATNALSLGGIVAAKYKQDFSSKITLTAGSPRWIRIAESSYNYGTAIFTIGNNYYSKETSGVVIAATWGRQTASYMSATQLAGCNAAFTKFRIIKDMTDPNAKVYFEVFCNLTATETLYVEVTHHPNAELMTKNVDGSLPAQCNVYELEIINDGVACGQVKTKAISTASLTASGNISTKTLSASSQVTAGSVNTDSVDTREVILGQGVRLWYDEANGCVRCNKPIVSTGNISAFN